jgi:hypothetical protein
MAPTPVTVKRELAVQLSSSDDLPSFPSSKIVGVFSGSAASLRPNRTFFTT